MQTTGLL